jgi:hypothetical protein
MRLHRDVRRGLLGPEGVIAALVRGVSVGAGGEEMTMETWRIELAPWQVELLHKALVGLAVALSLGGAVVPYV